MPQKQTVYADNAATTPLSGRALEEMLPWLSASYGNPSAVYGKGREARRAIEKARTQVAKAIGAAQSDEIAFTSGGTESDNWAVKSAAKLMASQGKRHIVTTAIEHPAVLASVRALEREGFQATYIAPDRDGVVQPEAVAAAVREDTGLVSVMYANNEIGALQPIREIGTLCRKRGILFHTDAVQAVGAVPVDVQADRVDMLTLSAHKFHGPKGAGALYLRNGIALPPYLDGGGQERGLRAGTENAAGIVGLATALEEAADSVTKNAAYVKALRDRLLEGILALPGTVLNGHREKRLPGNLNVSFDGVEGETLLLMLDLAGIAASSASACTSGATEPSHVLTAIGLSERAANSALRLTLGPMNTAGEVQYILETLPAIVDKLRRMTGWSPSSRYDSVR